MSRPILALFISPAALRPGRHPAAALRPGPFGRRVGRGVPRPGGPGRAGRLRPPGAPQGRVGVRATRHRGCRPFGFTSLTRSSSVPLTSTTTSLPVHPYHIYMHATRALGSFPWGGSGLAAGEGGAVPLSLVQIHRPIERQGRGSWGLRCRSLKGAVRLRRGYPRSGGCMRSCDGGGNGVRR